MNASRVSSRRFRAITKRVLIAAAKRGTLKAAEASMEIDGYNVVARKGWIVKLYSNGKVERLSKITKHHIPVILD